MVEKLRVSSMNTGAGSEERASKKARKTKKQGEFTSHWLSPHFSAVLLPVWNLKTFSHNQNHKLHIHIACIYVAAMDTQNLFIYIDR